MSVHYHVFLGPYLEVHNPIKATTVKKRSCPNEQCFNNGELVQANFCPKCGTKVLHIEVAARGRKAFNAYDELDGERLIELRFEDMPKECKDFMYFHSNLTKCAGRTFCDSTEIVPMDENTPNAEKERFARDFAKEIARIKEVFGESAIKIKWGAIAYWY